MDLRPPGGIIENIRYVTSASIDPFKPIFSFWEKIAID